MAIITHKNNGIHAASYTQRSKEEAYKAAKLVESVMGGNRERHLSMGSYKNDAFEALNNLPSVGGPSVKIAMGGMRADDARQETLDVEAVANINLSPDALAQLDTILSAGADNVVSLAMAREVKAAPTPSPSPQTSMPSVETSIPQAPANVNSLTKAEMPKPQIKICESVPQQQAPQTSQQTVQVTSQVQVQNKAPAVQKMKVTVQEVKSASPVIMPAATINNISVKPVTPAVTTVSVTQLPTPQGTTIKGDTLMRVSPLQSSFSVQPRQPAANMPFAPTARQISPNVSTPKPAAVNPIVKSTPQSQTPIQNAPVVKPQQPSVPVQNQQQQQTPPQAVQNQVPLAPEPVSVSPSAPPPAPANNTPQTPPPAVEQKLTPPKAVKNQVPLAPERVENKGDTLTRVSPTPAPVSVVTQTPPPAVEQKLTSSPRQIEASNPQPVAPPPVAQPKQPDNIRQPYTSVKPETPRIVSDRPQPSFETPRTNPKPEQPPRSFEEPKVHPAFENHGGVGRGGEAPFTPRHERFTAPVETGITHVSHTGDDNVVSFVARETPTANAFGKASDPVQFNPANKPETPSAKKAFRKCLATGAETECLSDCGSCPMIAINARLAVR
jgi:hypothetical protein